MNPTIPGDLLEFKDRFEAWRINPRHSEARASGPFLLFRVRFPQAHESIDFYSAYSNNFPKGSEIVSTPAVLFSGKKATRS
jgi:hypothetical protein